MTIDECAVNVSKQFLDANRLALGIPIDRTIEEVSAAIIGELQALIYAESKRCAAILDRFAQAHADAWGPGASNPPKTSHYRDEILATSPGKGGG